MRTFGIRLLTLSLLPAAAFAMTGSGTSGDPYVITSCQDLSDMRNNVAATDFYTLGSDIDCGVSPFDSGFTPIPSFAGDLDGANHTISSFTITGTANNVGLFAMLTGSVSNLSMTGASVAGGEHVGVVAGQTDSATVSNVTVQGALVSINRYAGLIAGTGTESSFSDVHTSGTIDVDNPSGGIRPNGGGLLGQALNYSGPGTEVHISDSSSTAIIYGSASGGLVGNAYSVIIERSASEGSITGMQNIGGLIGIGDYLQISDSYFLGSISGTTQAGGIVAHIQKFATIERVYSGGSFSASSGNTGGIFSHIQSFHSGGVVDLFHSFSAPTTVSAGGHLMGGGKHGNGAVGGTYHYDFPVPVDFCFAQIVTSVIPLNGACTETNGGPSLYFSSSTPPMAGNWDFTTVWEEVDGRLPGLRSLPIGIAPLVCNAGSPHDWDADGTDDGCLGTGGTVDSSVTVPAGTKLGDNVIVGRGATFGTGVDIEDDVVIGAGAQIGDDVTLGALAIVGGRAVIGPRTVIGSDTTIGRAADVGADNEFGSSSSVGYGSITGDFVQVDGPLVLGNLSQLGVTGAASGAVDCTGPLVIARSSAVAASGDGSLTCTGSVTVGPDSDIGPGAVFGDSIRIRKNALMGNNITVGDDVRIGRGSDIRDDVDLANNSTLGAYATICEDTSGNIGRGETVGVCN